MKTIWAFITQLDKQAVRAIAVLLVMFLLVIIMITLGRDIIDLPESELQEIFSKVKASGFALPITILIFCLAAFIGVPQWALIAGVIVAFGPINGSLYAWVATMCSATLDFWLGRWMGAERLKRYGGELVNRIIAVVRDNGFITSFAIRFVPTGPFVLVNMAAGVTKMKFISFASGTGLGIIPKILVVALVAQGVLSRAEGKTVTAVFVGLATVLIIAMFFARKRLKESFDKK